MPVLKCGICREPIYANSASDVITHCPKCGATCTSSAEKGRVDLKEMLGKEYNEKSPPPRGGVTIEEADREGAVFEDHKGLRVDIERGRAGWLRVGCIVFILIAVCAFGVGVYLYENSRCR